LGGRVEVVGGIRGRIFPWENFSLGKRLSMKGAQDFLAIVKQNEKINMKSIFLLKLRSSGEIYAKLL